MSAFDNLATSLVKQCVLALKALLDKPSSELHMLLVPSNGILGEGVWLQLGEDSNLSTESRIQLLDVLMHLCKKWGSVFEGTAKHQRGKEVLFSC